MLDFLADDFPSLLACATVCRTWTSTAQSLIFSRVNLRRDDGKKRQAISDHTLHSISAFSNLFSSHVHLASFVHTIQLRSRGPALFRNARKGNSWWRPLNESLGPLIPQFTRLKCLELSYERIYGWDAFVAWEGVRTLTLGSPHLRELDLCTVTFENIASLLRLLSDVDALEVLSMQGIAFIETEHPLDPKDALPHAYTTDKRLRLKSLSIHGMPRHIYEVLISAFLHPQSPADIRFLHCLELHWDHNMVIAHNSNSAVPFLSSNQKTLEHFSTCESFEAGTLMACALSPCFRNSITCRASSPSLPIRISPVTSADRPPYGVSVVRPHEGGLDRHFTSVVALVDGRPIWTVLQVLLVSRHCEMECIG